MKNDGNARKRSWKEMTAMYDVADCSTKKYSTCSKKYSTVEEEKQRMFSKPISRIITIIPSVVVTPSNSS